MSAPDKMTPEAARAALGWLAEMGADELVAEAAINRMAPPPPVVAAKVDETAPVPGDPAASLNSLAEIAVALSRFEACPLKKTAANLVYSDGNPLADVMFIGEAPGREEDLSGKPFVGRSGQLLDRMLAFIGLSRKSEDPASAAFITNVIYWRPPGNRTPTEQETLMCLPFVRRTIAVKQPKLIVTLGNIPTQRLLGRTEGILKSRGRWYDLDIEGRTYPLLATLHPAYLLRQPAQKRLAWRDLLTLKERIGQS